MHRQSARINTEVDVRALQADLPPIEQVLNLFRDIQDESVYGSLNEETLKRIGELAVQGIVAAKEVKR